jgi:hypothetical protein
VASVAEQAWEKIDMEAAWKDQQPEEDVTFSDSSDEGDDA